MLTSWPFPRTSKLYLVGWRKVLASLLSSNAAASNKHGSTTLTFASFTEIEEAKLWHMRMGHISFGKIKSAKGLDVKGCIAECLCNVCPLAKQTRCSFIVSSIKTNKPLELFIWMYGTTCYS